MEAEQLMPDHLLAPRLLVTVPFPCPSSHDWEELAEPFPGWGLCRQCRLCGLLVTRSWWSQPLSPQAVQQVRRIARVHPDELLCSIVALLDLRLPVADRAAMRLLAQWVRCDLVAPALLLRMPPP